VTEEEPIGPDSPFLALHLGVITAHSVGNSGTPMESCGWEVDEIAEVLVRGRWPKGVVNRGAVTARWDMA
jgi:hypothetical protein